MLVRFYSFGGSIYGLRNFSSSHSASSLEASPAQKERSGILMAVQVIGHAFREASTFLLALVPPSSSSQQLKLWKSSTASVNLDLEKVSTPSPLLSGFHERTARS